MLVEIITISFEIGSGFMAKMLFARSKDTGKIVGIDEVDGGLACNCECPHCKAKLEAKKGKKRAHHFAHYDRDETSFCSESALHLAAKEILKEIQEITLPKLMISESGCGKDFEVLSEGCLFKYDKVRIEESISIDGDVIRPDVIVSNDKAILAIELLVTHAVDDEKKQKFERAKLTAIEIDLRNCNVRNRSTLENILRYDLNVKKWIYSRRRELIKEKCLKRVAKFKIENRLKVKECPLKIWQGNMLGSYIGECYDCKYCYGIDENQVWCLGIDRITKVNELLLDDIEIEKHKNKVVSNELMNDRKLLLHKICPAHYHPYYKLKAIGTQVRCLCPSECKFFAQIDYQKDLLRYKNRRNIWEFIKLSEFRRIEKDDLSWIDILRFNMRDDK